jgi:predicted MFS family arabinose efflux permease
MPIIRLACALSLGAALSLGLARFAYALLVPPMRADLGWSYAVAGLLNTSNAAGYLLGALTAPLLLRRLDATRLFMLGAVLSCVWMGLSGFFRDTPMWLALRALAGVSSAWVFVTGGILAARLSSEQPQRGGLVIALFYGGTGLGITASALLVPTVMGWMQDSRYPAWAWGWWALSAAAVLATGIMSWPARVMRPWMRAGAQSAAPTQRRAWQELGAGLAAYSCFGMGYIGYMTFVIALLRTQGASSGQVMLFFSLLGLAVIASARLWAGLLSCYPDGRPLMVLNGLLGVATLIPALTSQWVWMLASGVLFGGVFLQVVGSTTALVRHQWPQDQWARGIALFTIIFAAGQIVGPTLVGWISDGAGGLQRGLLVSALILWCGSVLAVFQKPPRDWSAVKT